MRLAILASFHVPWSRQVIVELARLGHSIEAIDFASDRQFRRYAGADNNFHSETASILRSVGVGISLIGSPYRSILRYLTSAARLRAICQTGKIEALLTLYGGGFATLAYLSRFRPYGVFVVGSDVLRARGVKRWVAAQCLVSADLVLANGKHLADETSALIPKRRVVPLYLGVNTTRFAPQQRSGAAVKVICTRGFLPIYNNEYLIQGLAGLRPSTGEFRVTFVSGGPLLQDARELAASVLPAWMRGKVEFLGGVSEQDLQREVTTGDVYVSLSRSDGTSISLLEALASGLFPVLSDIPANREWVSATAQNGILVPLDQPGALTQALDRAISDEGLRRQAAVHNRQQVLERACIHRNMQELVTNLESAQARYRAERGCA